MNVIIVLEFTCATTSICCRPTSTHTTCLVGSLPIDTRIEVANVFTPGIHSIPCTIIRWAVRVKPADGRIDTWRIDGRCRHWCISGSSLLSERSCDSDLFCDKRWMWDECIMWLPTRSHWIDITQTSAWWHTYEFEMEWDEVQEDSRSNLVLPFRTKYY